MKAEDIEKTAALLRSTVLPALSSELDALRSRALDARARLPDTYPELARGEMSDTARLHGDISILAGAIEAAVDAANTAASGVPSEEEEDDGREARQGEEPSQRVWTVAEIAGVMRHLAWQRPVLLGGALWAVCGSAELSELCRRKEPTPQALADLALTSRSARELARANGRGRQILRTAPPGRRESLRDRLDRRVEQAEELMASPSFPEDARPVMERTCRAAMELVTSTIRMQEAEYEMGLGLADLVTTGHVTLDLVLAVLAQPKDVS